MRYLTKQIGIKLNEDDYEFIFKYCAQLSKKKGEEVSISTVMRGFIRQLKKQENQGEQND